MRAKSFPLLLLAACSGAGAPAAPIRPTADSAAEETADAAVFVDAARMTTPDARAALALDVAADVPSMSAADAGPDAAAEVMPAMTLGPAGGACPGGPYGAPLPPD